MTTFKNCSPGDTLDASAIYRLTIVPAAAGVTSLLWTDGQWTATMQGVPDMLSATPVFAAQAKPTIVTDPGYAGVIDTVARQEFIAAGNNVQSIADAVNDMEFDLSLSQVEKLSAGNATAASVNPANQVSAQAASGAATATAQAASSLTSTLSSVGKMLLIGIALVAVIVVASKSPKL